MTPKQLHQEQLEEMRRDMLLEQQLRTDYDAALDYIIDKYDLHAAVKTITDATKEFEFYGWYINNTQLIQELL